MTFETSANQQHNDNKSNNFSISQLLTKTKAGLKVRIIVTLNVEGFTTPSPETIASTQAKLLSELSAYQVDLVKKYKSIPALVLNVDHEALQHLLVIPIVKHISPDGLASTMGTKTGEIQNRAEKSQKPGRD